MCTHYKTLNDRRLCNIHGTVHRLAQEMVGIKAAFRDSPSLP